MLEVRAADYVWWNRLGVDGLIFDSVAIDGNVVDRLLVERRLLQCYNPSVLCILVHLLTLMVYLL